jgi:hypothetical protein
MKGTKTRKNAQKPKSMHKETKQGKKGHNQRKYNLFR